MPIVKFTGYVTPRGIIQKFGWEGSFNDGVFAANIKFSIIDSVVSADCEISENGDFAALHVHVVHMIRGVVDAASFVRGQGLTLIIDVCTLPDKEPDFLIDGDGSLAANCPLSMNEVLDYAMKDRRIFKHIHEMTATLGDPFDAPARCYRAIEGISHLIFASPPGKDKQRWKALKEALNLSEDYLRFVTSLSEGPRHGRIGPQLPNNVFECQKRAWVIAGRFLAFRKQENVNLTPPEFILL